MRSFYKTKMAEKLVGCEGATSSAATEDNHCDKDASSSLEKRYSLKEANEIGKEVLESIQSALMPRVGVKKEEIQDPYTKAWKYMEERSVLQMLEILLTKLVYERPDVPVQFMADEIQNMKGKDLRHYKTFEEEITDK